MLISTIILYQVGWDDIQLGEDPHLFSSISCANIPVFRDPDTNLLAVELTPNTTPAETNLINGQDIVVVHQQGNDVNNFQVLGYDSDSTDEVHAYLTKLQEHRRM